MGSRLKLHEYLKTLINNVYYQPPESKKIEYPAIIYSKDQIRNVLADDSKYNLNTSYEIIIIDRLPDNKAITELLKMPYSTYDRHYVSDGLNHDVITLYF